MSHMKPKRPSLDEDRARRLGQAASWAVAAFVVAVVVLTIWPPPPPEPTPTATPLPAPTTTPLPEIVIEIASSNTKQNWLTAVVAQFNAEGVLNENGLPIVVRVTHVTSGGSQQAILSGDLKPTVWSPGEYSWVGVANEIWKARTGKALAPDSCPQTALAPSGLAMWRPMAEALGWPDKPIGWADILARAEDPAGWATLGHPEWGSFKFGHPHPGYSNVGSLTMTSLAYYAIGKTEGLTAADVFSDPVREAFRRLELNTYHYGIESRNLLALMVSRGPSYLHAVATSEAETLRTNAEHGSELRFPLVFVFPADGTFWSEHPYCVLDGDWVSTDQKDAARIFLDYLLAPEAQQVAIENYIRPVDKGLTLHAPLALEDGTDPRVTTVSVPRLESPVSEVTDSVAELFYATKKPATVILVIDTSGSMAGTKISSAVQSAQNFVSRLDRRDEVYVLGFSDTPYSVEPGGLVSVVGERLVATLGGLIATGNTALYDATCAAVDQIAQLKRQHDADGDPHLYGIVILSDGEDTASGRGEAQMLSECVPESESADGVKVFTIAYGNDANRDQLSRIATRTNGRALEANPENIETIYRTISAEQ